ncbi:MAG TPA: hypothetical protein VHB21_19525 [Minicystis sp.]|nr:hypothetical protein [Minicystis sp.]
MKSASAPLLLGLLAALALFAACLDVSPTPPFECNPGACGGGPTTSTTPSSTTP